MAAAPHHQAALPIATSGASSSSVKVPSCRSMEEYDQLLRQKRRELDREIETFHARKEKEFLAFQRSLRAELNREKDRQRDADAAATATAIADGSGPEKSGQSSADAKGKAADAPQPLSSDSKRPHPLKARDAELSGLFTPAYLPLLEASTDRVSNPVQAYRNDQSSDEDGVSSSKNELSVISRRAKRASAPLPLSSSLTLSKNIYDGNSGAQTLQASSAPRPGMADRRSSSRSDTSNAGGAALRSVLRQPRSPDGGASGKSPKHVLFSINNTVVAPSSSPSLTRHQDKKAQAGGKANASAGRANGVGHSIGSGLVSSAGASGSTATQSFLVGRNSQSDSPGTVRGIPSSLRMTPVRTTAAPTLSFGEVRQREDAGYFDIPGEAAVSARSQPSPSSARNVFGRSTLGVLSSASLPTGAASTSMPQVSGASSSLSINTSTPYYAIPMRRTSSGGSVPRTPTSATLASALLDTTVPAELQESAGAVPDVLDGGTDPLFDFDEGDEGFEDIESDEEVLEGEDEAASPKAKNSASADKKSGKGGRGRNKTAAEDSRVQDDEGSEARIGTNEGGLPASLPIEIKWAVRRPS